MAREIIMPQMGLSMESGKIAQWLKGSGDKVNSGEVLLEVESDKATIQVEAVDSGILQITAGPDAGDIRVGSVIGYILAEGEAVRSESAGATTSVPTAGLMVETLKTGGDSEQKTNAKRSTRAPSSPSARRRARELGVDWTHAVPTGLRGQIKERDVLNLASQPARESSATQELEISPVARNLAESFGLDLTLLATMFPGKRIERTDVEQSIRQIIAQQTKSGPRAVAATHLGSSTAGPLGRSVRRQPMSSLRRLIADRMAQSAHTTAPVTLTTEADASELVQLRESMKADSLTAITPSYNVLLAKIVAIALLEHPDLNATIEGSEIVRHEMVNVGIAVDTERGLVVPVLHNVQAKPLRELASEADELLDRASLGRAMPDELTGGTFTITNLGMYDIDAFTPIINLPEAAVLGVGRLIRKLVVTAGDTTALRTMLALSLTFDHRLVDGAPAARFLQRVKQFVEQPYLWLTRDTNP